MDNSERFEIEIPADLAQFVHAQVGQGLQPSDKDVICEALRIMKDRANGPQTHAEKLNELRTMVSNSIARGGRNTMADLDRSLAATYQELRNEGY